MSIETEIKKRRTFAIISHPDAGKTTITEKLLLIGKAIHLAGSVKSRKSSRHATSDWMEIEKQRGISVTTSVMQFHYGDCVINLLDTPGHADFSEDTYRTLTAVDSVLMVIDGTKGVEERTIKLMEVCRMRDIPIMTWINKLDRETRPPLELLDELEKILGIATCPITWPLGCGNHYVGNWHRLRGDFSLYEKSAGEGLMDFQRKATLAEVEKATTLEQHDKNSFLEEQELIEGVLEPFQKAAYLAGKQTPVFFGTAMGNFGLDDFLQFFVEQAPSPQPRSNDKQKLLEPTAKEFTAFVFKIQANMDPNHHDRLAFLRICSGSFTPGMKVLHVRTKKNINANSALGFKADERKSLSTAYAGDVIGLHNHGSIQIGDTFSQKSEIRYLGIPFFAPELFRRVILRNPLKNKQLQKGLDELSEEGVAQVFRPKKNNDLIIGAIGQLQFDLLAFRLEHEYQAECSYDATPYRMARWVSCPEEKTFVQFTEKLYEHLATDAHGNIVYLGSSQAHFQLTQERWEGVEFAKTREYF